MKRTRPTLELSRQDLDRLLEHARPSLTALEYEQLRAALDTLVVMMNALQSRNATIGRLRQMLFGGSSEKTAAVLKSLVGDGARATDQSGGSPDSSDTGADAAAGNGHGRLAATDYPGATVVPVPHPQHAAGERCPACARGTLYPLEASPLVRITGQAPLAASIYELTRLRCSACQQVYTAPAPNGMGRAKYDARSASMLALLKYGSGMPFHRLQGLQQSLGMPLPASTQWEIVQESCAKIQPAYRELIRQAAHGEVLYNDDTTARILALMTPKELEPVSGPPSPDLGGDAPSAKVQSERSGIFTSGIVATRAQRSIALFFTGRRHAGENLGELLKLRQQELDAPIQMCDALSRNYNSAFKTILAHCLAHARRKYVEVAADFPSECLYVLDTLGAVYRHDGHCAKNRFTPAQRLQWHQAHSQPLMEQLAAWMNAQFEQRHVEPNSGLGEAIGYMQKHWQRLTLFLRHPGAPLDSNEVERALKRAILHRKNALFYKSSAGAEVGDTYMSLIHTCGLARVNPFDYLTTLHEHPEELGRDPAAWMPWNFRDTLTATASSCLTAVPARPPPG